MGRGRRGRRDPLPSFPMPCPTCGGSGTVTHIVKGVGAITKPCSACKGTGKAK